jgi:hypothetical protein
VVDERAEVHAMLPVEVHGTANGLSRDQPWPAWDEGPNRRSSVPRHRSPVRDRPSPSWLPHR